MSASTSWPAFLAQVAFALVVAAGGAAYVLRRIKEQKKEGKSVDAIMADGAKPMTGSVWLDGAIVAVLVFGTLFAIMYGFSRV
jgi:hypothetical protein